MRKLLNKLYPVYLNLTDRKVIVVGGGDVARRKVKTLLECGARVTVISPELTEDIKTWQETNQIKVIRRKYKKGDIDQAFLVVAACGDPQVNQQVFAEANEQNILCNVVDEPSLCSFQVPAVVNRGPLQIAISTAGISPALAREIAKQLREHFGSDYEVLLDTLLQLRTHLKKKYPNQQDQPRRAVILEKFIRSNPLELLQQGKREQFDQLVEKYLKQ
jgi:precorrin-2 dehydrogenase/sirohydrochlorin ferrochelatase